MTTPRPEAPGPAGAPGFAGFALSLEGVAELRHFESRAFSARRIFASLTRDGKQANILLSQDEQEYWCARLPGSLVRLPNAMGRRGWTSVRLSGLDVDEVERLVRLAWRNGQARAGCGQSKFTV